MVRDILNCSRLCRRFPHPRGDGPGTALPRCDSESVFPTRVGMVRERRRFPHPRGDGPKRIPWRLWLGAFPTRLGMVRAGKQRNMFHVEAFPTRVGWSGRDRHQSSRGGAFPTHVRMVRSRPTEAPLRFKPLCDETGNLSNASNSLCRLARLSDGQLRPKIRSIPSVSGTSNIRQNGNQMEEIWTKSLVHSGKKPKSLDS